MSDKISQLIVETFEKEQPSLCLAIKQAVDVGESRANFIMSLKGVFGFEYKTSLTYSASLTVFDYYKKTKTKIKP